MMTPATAWSSFPFAAPPAAPPASATPPPAPAKTRAVAGFGRAPTAPATPATAKRAGFVAGFARA